MRKRSNGFKIAMWVLALGWAAVLFVFSGQDGVQSGGLSRAFTQWLLRLFPSLPWSVAQLEPVLRKVAHFVIFAFEGFLLSAAMQLTLRARGRAAGISAVICAGVAGLNEFHQSFVDGRHAALTDVLIDTGGAVLGVLLACLLIWGVRRLRARRRNVII